jgi:hypothetical protein
MWSQRKLLRGNRPEWPRIPDAPVGLPESSGLYLGWDGNLYVVEDKGRYIARLGRDGKCHGVLWTSGLRAGEVHAFAVDRSGRMQLLHAHAEKLNNGAWSHLAQIGPQGDARDWMGPHAPAGSPLIGQSDNRLQLAPDGTVFVGRDLGSLRIFTPDGRPLWRSLATDEDTLRRDLERARRPKKAARDEDDEPDEDEGDDE